MYVQQTLLIFILSFLKFINAQVVHLSLAQLMHYLDSGAREISRSATASNEFDLAILSCCATKNKLRHLSNFITQGTQVTGKLTAQKAFSAFIRLQNLEIETKKIIIFALQMPNRV